MPILDKSLHLLSRAAPAIVLAVAVVSACTLLTGCGGGGSSAEPDPASVVGVATPTAPTAAQAVQVLGAESDLPPGTPGGRDSCSTSTVGSGFDVVTVSQCWTNSTRLSCTSAKDYRGVLFAPALCTRFPA